MRRLNSRAPINRLPNELLVEIFTFAIDSSGYRDRHVVRIRLASVSKNWSRTVFETPSLWTEISSYYNEGWNRAVVLRSKEYPLMVEYNQSHRWATDEFMDLTIPVAYRWKSAAFRLVNVDSLDLLRGFVPLSAPQLEELTVECSDVDAELSVGGNIDIFSGGADRLRHIHLLDVPILWSSRLLSGLETLAIVDSNFRFSPSSTEVMNVLRRCPELRDFELVHNNQEDIHTSFDTSTEEDIVHLPLLTSFTLDLDSAEAFGRIISSVRIPACTRFYLKCSNTTRNIFSNKTNHLTAALLSTIRHLPKISLSLLPSTVVLSGWQDLKINAIDIDLAHHTPWEDLVCLIECTGAEVTWPPISASITCEEPLPFLQVAGILRRMPSIVRLELTGDSDQYITQLAHPTFSNGIYKWVLPNLKELKLHDCPHNSLQPLIDLSRRHHRGVDMDRGDGLRLELPIQLEKIRVERAGQGWGPFEGPFYTALQNLKREDWGENMVYG
ncbi:hypothetical protein FRB94_005995 [Tulasnella sp. JGI-2019a]|nr:hypothetical protein FRB94_005995 [Tulasnella sp. JGI-2019a]